MTDNEGGLTLGEAAGHGRVPPVDEGDTLELYIRDLGKEGDGVGDINGYIVFVPDTSPGDTVPVRITYAGPSFAKAEVRDDE